MNVSLTVVAATSAACTAALLTPRRGRPMVKQPGSRPRETDPGPLHRHRLAWSLGAGTVGLLWLPGPPGAVAAALLAATTWVLIGRAEPRAVRRARDAARADLPHLVLLLAAAVRSGGSAEVGLALASDALPGAAAQRLAGLRSRLALGMDPVSVWAQLGSDPVLAPLGRSLARAYESGTPVADAVEHLAADLGRRARAEAEDRARAVGVRAAVPLGLCLLPSFLLLGIVPLVAGLLRTVLP